MFSAEQVHGIGVCVGVGVGVFVGTLTETQFEQVQVFETPPRVTLKPGVYEPDDR